MELIIYEPSSESFVKEIAWNNEEIKKEVAEKVEVYKNLVYTEDQVKDAKEDRAKLNKFVTALEDKRKEIKKQCLEPYERFEKQIKEITAIVKEPIALIDNQLNEYEAKKKAEKKEQIAEYFAEANTYEWLDLEMIFDQRWLNASLSLTKAKAELDEKISKIGNDLEILSKIPEFSFEATKVYKSCLDLLRATNEAQRMSEIAKRKAEEEARRKAEVEAIQEAVEEQPAVEVEPVPEVEEVERQWISFSAYISADDAKALKKFFVLKNIEFKRI